MLSTLLDSFLGEEGLSSPQMLMAHRRGAASVKEFFISAFFFDLLPICKVFFFKYFSRLFDLTDFYVVFLRQKPA